MWLGAVVGTLSKQALDAANSDEASEIAGVMIDYRNAIFRTLAP